MTYSFVIMYVCIITNFKDGDISTCPNSWNLTIGFFFKYSVPTYIYLAPGVDYEVLF